MSLIAVGTNYKYSPITLRERISFSKKRLRDALNFLKESSTLRGAAILSTCNRVEVYASTEEAEAGIREIEAFISRYHEIDKEKACPYLYRYTDKEAMRHLLSVASGLDSLILGETQILSQVRSSFLESEGAGFVDRFLEKAFNLCLFLAKRIHRETKISEGKASVGSVAIDFIKEKRGTLSNKNILIIGVGKVTELLLQYLKEENPNVVFISNRTFEKARSLASRIGAKAVRLDELNQYLKKANLLITATGSPHFIIRKETLEGVIEHNLLIVDLALPRDVEPGVKDIENVELFCLEDFDSVIKQNIAKKREEAEKVKEIINIEVERLWKELTELEQEPALLP